jgi:hypothetical protein
MGCGLRVAGSRFLLFTIRPSLLAIRYPLPCRFADFTTCRQVFGRANFLVSPIWVRGAECGCQAKIFGNAGALPHKTTRYSLFAIRYRHRCFGFNWRVVLPHDRKLDEFGCSGEQPSSFVPARPKFFGTAEPCPPEKPFRYSLLATRHPLGFPEHVTKICDQCDQSDRCPCVLLKFS